MSIETVQIPGPRNLTHEARHRRVRRSRLDKPDLRPGNSVWWNGGLYAVESVELHGESWIAVLVKPGEVGSPQVECVFAPVKELQYEPTI